MMDEYIESGGKRDFTEIIKHGLNEDRNKQVQVVQYVSSDGKAVLTEQIVCRLQTGEFVHIHRAHQFGSCIWSVVWFFVQRSCS